MLKVLAIIYSKICWEFACFLLENLGHLPGKCQGKLSKKLGKILRNSSQNLRSKFWDSRKNFFKNSMGAKIFPGVPASSALFSSK